MYYRHDGNYLITEKSPEALIGENVLTHASDFDLELYDVIVGYVNLDGEILRHTKKLRSVDVVAARLEQMNQQQIEAEIETDYRLSLIELGLV